MMEHFGGIQFTKGFQLVRVRNEEMFTGDSMLCDGSETALRTMSPFT